MNGMFKKYKLRDITTIIAGGDLPISFSTEKTNRLRIPVYSNGEKNNGLYGYTDIPKINEPAVTISARGSKVGFAAIRNEPFFPIVRLLTLIPDQHKLDVGFLFYNLKFNRQGGVGSGQPQITVPDISNRSISVPPLSNQQKIASVLSSLDNKIEFNNKINAELEAMAKTLYDYWFVQFDFPNERGKPYKSSGGKLVWDERLKREIPEGWEVKQLGEIANITMGQSPEGSSYNDSGEGIIFYQGSTDFGWRFPTVRQYTTKPTRFAKAGDVLLSVRAPVGTYNVAKEACCIGRGLSALNSKDGFHSFLLYRMAHFKKKFDNINSVGTTFGSITKEDLHSLVLAYPSRGLLQRFENIVSNFDKQILIQSKQNQELVNLCDWLLPMLMNGQISVGEAYKEVEEVLSMAAEPQPSYATVVKLNISKKETGFAKQVLAGKIVSLFREDKHFGRIKLQKLQFLAEHIAQADLNWNYYFQRAGPYDNRFMHTIADSLRKSKWFDEQQYKFLPLQKQSQIDGYYQGYFAPVSTQLDRLFGLLANATEGETEIIATVYAVWNNRIILRQPITESLLLHDFYNWSERKQQYSEKQVLNASAWLKENEFEPKGFGKEIKTAKDKK